MSELKNIYASLDIGSNYIKGIVAEVHDDNFYILASSIVESDGIYDSIIEDDSRLVEKINIVMSELRTQVNIDFQSVVLGIPANLVSITKLYSETFITNESGLVQSDDVVRIAKDAALKFKIDEYDIINMIPFRYNIDGFEVSNCIGKSASKFGIEFLCFSAPKQSIYPYLIMADKANLNVVDICLSPLAEQYEILSSKPVDESYMIINLGYSSTSLLIKLDGELKAVGKYSIGISNVVSGLVDKYNIHPVETIDFIKSNGFSPDGNEDGEISFKLLDGSSATFSINEIRSYVNHLILSLLITIKNEADRYDIGLYDNVIMSGGALEISGFQLVVDKVFDNRVTLYNSKYIGARSPAYSTAFGLIKYIVNKNKERGKTDSIFDFDTQSKLLTPRKRILNLSEDSVIGKLFEYFFE